MNRICQCCGMPMPSDDLLGTNKDGSKNTDYCVYCMKDGEFIHNVSMEEYIDMCKQYGEQAGMSNDEYEAYMKKLFPTLKRWKKK